MAQRRMTGVKSLVSCEPSDDRCERAISPQKLPGISVRHTPSCAGDLCSLFGCSNGGNWRLTRDGTLDRAEWIKGWIMTQLLTRGYVSCEEHPLGKRGGGWWADVFRGAQTQASFRSGSKLWALQWMHGGATATLVQYARQYAQQALQPLLTWGLVSSLNVDAFYISRGPIAGRVSHVVSPGGGSHDRADPLGAIIQLKINVSGPGMQSSYSIAGSRMPNSIWLWREYLPSPAPHTTGGRYYQAVF